MGIGSDWLWDEVHLDLERVEFGWSVFGCYSEAVVAEGLGHLVVGEDVRRMPSGIEWCPVYGVAGHGLDYGR